MSRLWFPNSGGLALIRIGWERMAFGTAPLLPLKGPKSFRDIEPKRGICGLCAMLRKRALPPERRPGSSKGPGIRQGIDEDDPAGEPERRINGPGDRREQNKRLKGYREQTLRIHHGVCPRCGREFTAENMHLLTVHRKDHNHDNNPPDGSPENSWMMSLVNEGFLQWSLIRKSYFLPEPSGKHTGNREGKEIVSSPIF